MIKLENSIFTSSATGCLPDLKLLLDQGANPNEVDNMRQTPLLVAISKGHVAVVKMLLEKGANPNHSNYHGQTPLFLAASDDQLEIVTALLQHGANPNQTTRHGNTPLYIAVVSGYYTVAKLLLQHEATLPTNMSPFIAILDRLNTHVLTLINESIPHQENYTLEEARHEKIEFLILLTETIKRHYQQTDFMLTAVLNLEKRYQDKIFFGESRTRSLFQKVLRCLYTGNVFAFENAV